MAAISDAIEWQTMSNLCRRSSVGSEYVDGFELEPVERIYHVDAVTG
jgi:hypothetical protein